MDKNLNNAERAAVGITPKHRTMIDHVFSVAEELKLNGFEVETIREGFSYLIQYETMAGTFRYHCREETVMKEYYRFIRHYSSKLHSWALSMQLAS